MITETYFVVAPGIESFYHAGVVDIDEFPDETRVYLSERNAQDYPELDLARLM